MLQGLALPRSPHIFHGLLCEVPAPKATLKLLNAIWPEMPLGPEDPPEAYKSSNRGALLLQSCSVE